MTITHAGRDQFLEGTFGSGGENLFVDAGGAIRRITDNDLDNTGTFDIVLPNSHGYIERGPTYVYSRDGGRWDRTELPHDSCWMAEPADVDGDGYLDLVVANGENGVTSELESYVYWGGPDGLTGERTTFDTTGAYDVAVCDIDGNGLQDLVFTTAWTDHHNPGKPMDQKVYMQTSPREFSDATDQYAVPGVATTSLLAEDLDGDGHLDLVLANQRDGHDVDTESFVYWGLEDGFDTTNPVRLPTTGVSQVLSADLSDDGYEDLIFTGGGQIIVYWNDAGTFRPDDRLVIEASGLSTQFNAGRLTTTAADIDDDGLLELVIATKEGVQIRKADDLRSVWRSLPCENASWVTVADIDDGRWKDIVVSRYRTTRSYDTESVVFWGGDDGYATEATSTFETHGPMGCAAADLDNDGSPELVFCNTMSGPAQEHPEFPIYVYPGTAEHEYPVEDRREYPVSKSAHTYAAADVDNDGYVELITTTWEGVRIFDGTPTGPDPTEYDDLVHPLGDRLMVGGVMVGDFDRDGWLDLVVAPWIPRGTEEELENSVLVYFGGPDGYTDDRRMVLPAHLEVSQAILLADVDRDGYVDFLYGDADGSIGVYYGGPDGFDRDRFEKIPLPEYNGALIMGLSAADVDDDGWLELFATTAGHYTRKASHLYVLGDGENGYPEDEAFVFDTGGTTGFPALADVNGDGNLDLLLPFYSTTETRELPARIFLGDGEGGFDWDDPITFDDLPAPIAFCPVDLTDNGYPDILVCCHRVDRGHKVDSRLIMNGPDGLNVENAQRLPGLGPHNLMANNQGNRWDRSDEEYYTSPVFECDAPNQLDWNGETPFETTLSFRVRFGATEEETRHATWGDPITERGTPLNAPADARYMQYRVTFKAPSLVNSPRLTSVTIDCE